MFKILAKTNMTDIKIRLEQVNHMNKPPLRLLNASTFETGVRHNADFNHFLEKKYLCNIYSMKLE